MVRRKMKNKSNLKSSLEDWRLLLEPERPTFLEFKKKYVAFLINFFYKSSSGHIQKLAKSL